jgi:hypothetical protein
MKTLLAGLITAAFALSPAFAQDAKKDAKKDEKKTEAKKDEKKKAKGGC